MTTLTAMPEDLTRILESAQRLGVEVNEEEVHKHPFEQEIIQRTFYPDGSVGDC